MIGQRGKKSYYMKIYKKDLTTTSFFEVGLKYANGARLLDSSITLKCKIKSSRGGT